MKKIGLLSDTHGFLDDKVFEHFKDCDEVWHAGDIGTVEVADRLAAFKPLRAVYGNIDGDKLRVMFKQHERWMCEGVDVWMTHIGGYPGKYAREVKPEIFMHPPKLFISGHSHILKVMYDKKLGTLHINPGAEGKYGFHNVRTLVRFEIDGTDIRNLEVIEIGMHRQKM
ncbi:MAG: metallophosphoesterase family protein [Paludibacteraceae bacterium]|jgi:putative phosphoesterase|nr:metallophosphoesterase family protein [Paludibacteraceae bacterium]MBQ2051906.1 metallophosphoesterase family protein [Paludibacteraceae bacterium]MBR6803550.1 metallophosphoesterase family protein [Paludibacteraceae bacterium]